MINNYPYLGQEFYSIERWYSKHKHDSDDKNNVYILNVFKRSYALFNLKYCKKIINSFYIYIFAYFYT